MVDISILSNYAPEYLEEVWADLLQTTPHILPSDEALNHTNPVLKAKAYQAKQEAIAAEIIVRENRSGASAYMVKAYARAAREGVNITTILQQMEVEEAAAREGLTEAQVWERKRSKVGI
jgi:hypothetical protein